jgi:tRNA pseudouridine38-40 synthase
VHALVNVVSLKVHFEDGLTERINAHLPSDIRVYDLVRTTNSFNPKRGCSGRIYEYLIPTFCFEKKSDASFRITKEKLEEVRSLFQTYVGNHFFHNFTRMESDKGKNYYRRIINAIEITDPIESQGLELCSIMINGESFMLHQIRKMIGLVVSICQGIYTTEIFKTCFEREVKVNTPMAPGIGLALNILFYDHYNNMQGNIHGELHLEKYTEQRESLRKKVHEHIAEQEVKGEVYLKWIPDLLVMHEKDYFANEEKGSVEESTADNE